MSFIDNTCELEAEYDVIVVQSKINNNLFLLYMNCPLFVIHVNI